MLIYSLVSFCKRSMTSLDTFGNESIKQISKYVEKSVIRIYRPKFTHFIFRCWNKNTEFQWEMSHWNLLFRRVLVSPLSCTILKRMYEGSTRESSLNRLCYLKHCAGTSTSRFAVSPTPCHCWWRRCNNQYYGYLDRVQSPKSPRDLWRVRTHRSSGLFKHESELTAPLVNTCV